MDALRAIFLTLLLASLTGCGMSFHAGMYEQPGEKGVQVEGSGKVPLIEEPGVFRLQAGVKTQENVDAPAPAE